MAEKQPSSDIRSIPSIEDLTFDDLGMNPPSEQNLPIYSVSRGDPYLALLLLTRRDISRDRRDIHIRLERPSIQQGLQEGVEFEIMKRQHLLDMRQSPH
jgi:hypothetical protein